VNFTYCGLISFQQAQELQMQTWLEVRHGRSPDTILGFELEPTVTLGARGGEEDILWLEQRWREQGFTIARAERGGQATLHNPGQLVIFPTVNIRKLGVKKFVCVLSDVTREFLRQHGTMAKWMDADPGLYTDRGKIMSLGLRVKAGIVTHGIAINVHNDLAPFSGIRVCGRQGVRVDKLHTERPLSELFSSWAGLFKAQLTRPSISHNLGADPELRL